MKHVVVALGKTKARLWLAVWFVMSISTGFMTLTLGAMFPQKFELISKLVIGLCELPLLGAIATLLAKIYLLILGIMQKMAGKEPELSKESVEQRNYSEKGTNNTKSTTSKKTTKAKNVAKSSATRNNKNGKSRVS